MKKSKIAMKYPNPKNIVWIFILEVLLYTKKTIKGTWMLLYEELQ
jgi:hypothetical protein